MTTLSHRLVFPDLGTLQAWPFERGQPVPNVPQIYLMYSPLDHAGRVGSCDGNSQFKRHAKPTVPTPGGRWGPSWGWFEDMHLSTPPGARRGMADSLARLGSSNFCWDAHRWGAARFFYYILDRVPQLNVRERRCLEQQFMDALRDQTEMEDYSGQAACLCGAHPAPRKYWRMKPRSRR